MIFQIIESSSSGNCSYLECDGVKILIDAGIGIRKICAYLSARGVSLEDLDGVFVTHEHTDHYAALRHFANCGVKVFANRPTAECVQYKDSATKKLNWNLFETGGGFDFYGVDVSSFSIPHDTSDPVGFTFSFGGKKLVYATDLGKVTDSVRSISCGADILVLESNYCPVMLNRSNRPFHLKNRIKSAYGHLSNAEAISLLSELSSSNIEQIFLAHVSKECNTVEHISELLRDSNICAGVLDKIEVVSPFSKASSEIIL